MRTRYCISNANPWTVKKNVEKKNKKRRIQERIKRIYKTGCEWNQNKQNFNENKKNINTLCWLK